MERGHMMSNIKNLTDDQIRELLSRPYSDENAKQLSEIDKADSWLLALNLRDMDREENEPDDGKGD